MAYELLEVARGRLSPKKFTTGYRRLNKPRLKQKAKSADFFMKKALTAFMTIRALFVFIWLT